ncbi:MAG: hypothetical protein WB493_05835 [Anaeromyxobacteraceae bacterium]
MDSVIAVDRSANDAKALLPIVYVILIGWYVASALVPLLPLHFDLGPELRDWLGFELGGESAADFVTTEDAWAIAILLLPRLAMLLGLAHFLASGRFGATGQSGLFWLPVVVLGLAFNVEYLSLSVLLLMSYHIARRPVGIRRWLVESCAWFGFLFLIGLHRGQLLLLMFPLAIRIRAFPLWGKAVAVSIGVAAVLQLSFLKFETDDVAVLGNVIARISFYNQYFLYKIYDTALAFNTGKPVTLDAIGSLPFIRQLTGSVNEVELFRKATGGQGGLAISPEIRAFSYWKDLYLAIADLMTLYGSVFTAFWVGSRIMPSLKTGAVLAFPLLIQIDSLNNLTLWLQIALVIGVMEFLYREYGRGAVDRATASTEAMVR